MFSINPLFPDYITGGASKHLYNIAIHFGQLGHDVQVICTRVPESQNRFQWHDRVEVLPSLPFKQPFPQPYAVPAYDLASIVYEMGEVLQAADRFYLHDGEFLFPYVYRNVPTVVSLRDNVYPETLISSFSFTGDQLILISEYSRQYYQHTAGRFFPELASRMQVIPNGIDWDRFKPTPPGDLLDIIPLQPGSRPVVLHPHRPEESKGLRQTIAVVDQLVHRHGITNVLALAPQWHESEHSSELRDFYQSVEQDIVDRGLANNFLFHDWVPRELMPAYYSLGSVTLSLGSFVEAFGNSVYESLGCGTPSIVARIATHRELLPDELIDKVDYDDIDEAAARAARIIRAGERTSPQTLDYLRTHYGIQRQLDRYTEVILGAQLREPVAYRHPIVGAGSRFVLAPWCYVSTRGIYNDFRADYADLGPVGALVRAQPGGFTLDVAAAAGIRRVDVMSAVRAGYLVPLD